MVEIWKEKAPRQAEFFGKFPTQFNNMSRQVWKWLNRVNKHRESASQYCLRDVVENMDHLWVCPALAKEQVYLQSRINGILQRLPFALDKVRTRESSFKQDWLRLASKDPLCYIIPGDRLDALTLDFWNANNHKQFIPPQGFSKAFAKVVRKTYPQELSKLLSLLIDLFSLNVEGNSNALQHFLRFELWCSEDPDDKEFGALGSFLQSDLSGKKHLSSSGFSRHCTDSQESCRDHQLIRTFSGPYASPTQYGTQVPSHCRSFRRFYLRESGIPSGSPLVQ